MGNLEKRSGRPAKNGEKPFTKIFRQLIDGETQQEAADKIGVSRQNIGKWITGNTTPDIETLCKIADAYNVTTDYLLGRTSNKTTDADLQAVCEYTGLSDKACDYLHKVQCFAKGQLKSKTYYEFVKEKEDNKKALLELYREHPELEQIMNEFLLCDDLSVEEQAYAQKHPLFEKAFHHKVMSEHNEEIENSLRSPMEEAEKDLMVINILLSTEKIWDLTHLLVVYFLTDFSKGVITGTVTSDKYGENNTNDSGRFFTLTHSTIENGVLAEIIEILKELKKLCTPRYGLFDVEQEPSNVPLSDYFLKDEPTFRKKDGDPNG